MPKRSPTQPVEQTTAEEEANQPLPFRVDDYNPSKTRILFITVAAFSIIMFVLWGWSLKQSIANFRWSSSSEGRLVADAQKNWDKIYNEQVDKQNTFSELKNNLQKIIKSAAATANTTTTSSTLTTSSTAPTVATNTLQTSSTRTHN